MVRAMRRCWPLAVVAVLCFATGTASADELDRSGDEAFFRSLSGGAPAVTCGCIGGDPENEPDCGLSGDPPNDTVNGGCNSTPNVFSPLACGQTICGTSGTQNISGQDYRDTDWYALELPGGSRVELSVVAQFAAFTGILNGGGAPVCVPDSSWMDNRDACVEFADARTLSAGTWWIFVAYQQFSGLTCGAPYTLTVLCPIFRSDFEAAGALCFWSDTEPPVLCV